MKKDFEIDPCDLQIHEQVGAGNTAEVFRGEYQGREVAIKQLFKHRRMDNKEQVSLVREVEILFNIRHANLVELFGMAFTKRPYRIVTEFCEGGTLFELLHNRQELQLTWTQKIKMCKDIASGMYYLHSFNPMIIHRDLKSLNLLLTEIMSSSQQVPLVKVTDFGLGRMKEDDKASWGKMTCQVGTLHWMAPEVFSGTNYDEKVDVYSYAMVLYEILCREIPFDEEEPSAIGGLITKGGRPNVKLVQRGCPDALRAMMVSSWAKDAKERPPFSKIESILDGLMQPTHTPSRVQIGCVKADVNKSSKDLARGPYSVLAL